MAVLARAVALALADDRGLFQVLRRGRDNIVLLADRLRLLIVFGLLVRQHADEVTLIAGLALLRCALGVDGAEVSDRHHLVLEVAPVEPLGLRE